MSTVNQPYRLTDITSNRYFDQSIGVCDHNYLVEKKYFKK